MRKNLTIEEVDDFIVRGLAGYASRFSRATIKQYLNKETQKNIAEQVKSEFFESNIFLTDTDPKFQLYYYCYFLASARHWKRAINRILKAGRYQGRTKKKRS